MNTIENNKYRRKRRPIPQTKGAGNRKTFVLDTNVMVHDPNSPWNFKDNIVIIPLPVLSELDQLKTKEGAVGASARAVCRRLYSLLTSSSDKIQTEQGGEIQFQTLPTEGKNPQLGSKYYADNIILEYVQQNPGYILVTKDLAMTLKGRALGLRVQDYKNDKSESRGQRTFRLSHAETVDNPQEFQLRRYGTANEYATVKVPDFESIPLRSEGRDGFRILKNYISYMTGNSDGATISLPCNIRIQPRNAEQWMLWDAIANTRVKLVTAIGKAGTGKTFIALSAALSETLIKRRYERIYITRPVVTIGRDLGALPGTMEEKMHPYLQPYFDNLAAIFRERDAYMKYVNNGTLTVEALTYIRGRNLENSIMIVDEAQNLTPHEAKTIITRMGRGSKLILLGDPDQIDSPYLDKNSNGLVYTQTKLRGSDLTAGVVLMRGERSELAELAADLL